MNGTPNLNRIFDANYLEGGFSISCQGGIMAERYFRLQMRRVGVKMGGEIPRYIQREEGYFIEENMPR
jgi:hypothetical protein